MSREKKLNLTSRAYQRKPLAEKIDDLCHEINMQVIKSLDVDGMKQGLHEINKLKQKLERQIEQKQGFFDVE